jgi:hypothetical protein
MSYNSLRTQISSTVPVDIKNNLKTNLDVGKNNKYQGNFNAMLGDNNSVRGFSNIVGASSNNV